MQSVRKKRPRVLIVLDDRLPEAKSQILRRHLHAFRSEAEVVLIPGGTKEEEVLDLLTKDQATLVLAPWYRYFAWTHLEGYFGLSRLSGPTFAGYFADQIYSYELDGMGQSRRSILLDLHHLRPSESKLLFKCLLSNQGREGVRALLQPNTMIYTDSWFSIDRTQRPRIEIVSRLREVIHSEWSQRTAALRISMLAFWSLYYEEGPGKAELPGTSSTEPRALFQIALDEHIAIMKLGFSLKGMNANDILKLFRSDANRPSAPAQILIRYTDFARIHFYPELNEIEILAGLFPSAPSNVAPGEVHTLWIEPLSQGMRSNDDRGIGQELIQLPQIKPEEDLSALKRQLLIKDEIIHELKLGGVGARHEVTPPDAEALLEALQERFFEAKLMIRQFQIEIHRMESRGANPQEVAELSKKMYALEARHYDWIHRITQALENNKHLKKSG